jgi:hypothetical protein
LTCTAAAAAAAALGATHGHTNAKSTYKPRASTVLPAAARKVTAAEASDEGQLASLLQIKAALDPGGVMDKVCGLGFPRLVDGPRFQVLLTSAEAGDEGQLASLLQLTAALDPGGVLDKVILLGSRC